MLFKNEFPIYIKNKYKLTTMNIEKEDVKNELCNESLFIEKSGVELKIMKEFYSNSECNFINEIKKVNILKNKLSSLFKEYKLNMGIFKKVLITLVKDIGEIQNNKEFNNKEKYMDCRIIEIALHDYIYEDIKCIISHIKNTNIETINKINIVSFTSKLLSIILFFKYDYIYFIDNYNMI